MENIKAYYEDLLRSYDTASQHFEETGSIRLLKHTLEELENFERTLIKHYSIEKLMELQSQLSSKQVAIV